MNLLEIKVKGKKYELEIDQAKIILLADPAIPYIINQTIKHILEKEEVSEFEEEQNSVSSVYWNEQKIEVKRWNFFYLSPHFDLNDDLKLGSKSLVLSYLESNLREIEYSDAFTMLNQSIEVLNQEFIEENTLTKLDDLVLKGRLKQFTLKSLVKFLEIQMCLEDSSCKDFDLPIDLKVSLLFRIVSTIAKKNPERSFIVVVDKGRMTSIEFSAFKDDIPKNMVVIVMATSLLGSFDSNQVILSNKGFIDLGSQEQRFISLIQDHGISEDPILLTAQLTTLFTDTMLHGNEINQILRRI